MASKAAKKKTRKTAPKGGVSDRIIDAALALARFDNGAIASIEGTRFAPGRRNYNRFEVNGSRGSLAFQMERMNELEYYSLDDDPKVQGFRQILATDPAHAYFKAWWPAGHIIGYEHTFTHTVFDFLKAVAAGKPVPPRSLFPALPCAPGRRPRAHPAVRPRPRRTRRAGGHGRARRVGHRHRRAQSANATTAIIIVLGRPSSSSRQGTDAPSAFRCRSIRARAPKKIGRAHV